MTLNLSCHVLIAQSVNQLNTNIITTDKTGLKSLQHSSNVTFLLVVWGGNGRRPWCAVKRSGVAASSTAASHVLVAAY